VFFRRSHPNNQESSDAWLVVGLGNPGKEYADTRHNIGSTVVKQWALDSGARLARLKSFGNVAKVSAEPTIYVAETSGFMNVSGPPAFQIARFYGIDAARVVVIHDDLDVPFGSIRLKWGGGHAGHNGVRSLQGSFATPEFFRVRMGIGRPPGRQETARFVLGGFTKDQQKEVPLLVERAKDAVMAIIQEGLTSAQQRIHAQPPVPPAP